MSSTDLEAALEDMRRENEALRGQLDAAQAIPIEVVASSPLNIVDAALKAERETNMALEREADEREAKLKQRDEDLAVLTEEIRRRDEIIATNELLASELFDLRDTLTHRDGDLAYKDRVIAETRDAVASLTEKLRIAESDINLLKAVRDKAYDEIGALNVRLAEVEMQKPVDLIAKLDDAEKRLHETETLASDLDTALVKANGTIADLARQLDEAKTTLGHAGTALERAMQPMIELVDVSRNGQHWVEVRVSLDDGQTTRLAALIDEAGWHGYLRLYPEHLGLPQPEPARTEG